MNTHKAGEEKNELLNRLISPWKALCLSIDFTIIFICTNIFIQVYIGVTLNANRITMLGIFLLVLCVLGCLIVHILIHKQIAVLHQKGRFGGLHKINLSERKLVKNYWYFDRKGHLLDDEYKMYFPEKGWRFLWSCCHLDIWIILSFLVFTLTLADVSLLWSIIIILVAGALFFLRDLFVFRQSLFVTEQEQIYYHL